MDIVAKCAAAAIFTSMLCLIIKKHNPELALAVGTASAILIILAAAPIFSAVSELVNCARDMLGTSSTLIKPILKCLAIGFISRLGADICKDASQAAVASALELAGTLCAASAAMPVIISTLKMIGTML